MIIPSTIKKLSNGAWQFDYTGTAPFQIWLNGMMLAETDEETYTVSLPNYDITPPPVEIVDGVDESSFVDAESKTYPSFLLIQWRGSLSASHYRVEQYVDGEWVAKKIIKESKFGYYLYQTPALEDLATAQWRVIPLDWYENEGTPLEISKKIVRNPPPPDVIISVAAGKIVVEA